MPPPDVPAHVRAFLRTQIADIEQLVCLLALQRRGGAASSLAEVASEARVSEEDAEAALRSLAAQGIVRVEGSGAELRATLDAAATGSVVAELARAWHENQLELLRLLSANALERLRTSAIRTFADAFLLRKKKPDG